MDERDDIPSDILQDIAYLSRTENRLVVLEALVEGPRSTRELREATGISKATVNRTLNEFEERSWARRTSDGTYEATPQAEHVAFQLRASVGSMESVASLGEDIGVLPVDDLTIGLDDDLTVGLHHFDDATVERQRPQAQVWGEPGCWRRPGRRPVWTCSRIRRHHGAWASCYRNEPSGVICPERQCGRRNCSTISERTPRNRRDGAT